MPLRGPTLDTSVPPWFKAKERLTVEIFEEYSSASIWVANEIANLIRQRQSRSCVLGLATGSTPVLVYRELCRQHKEQGLSFANVITFNLDEYYNLDPGEVQSYHRFMHEILFDHVDLLSRNIHMLDGKTDPRDVEAHCQEYERAIEAAGGIDVQLLGLGRAGHIGFNEKGSGADTTTRLVYLDAITRTDAASDFFGRKNVPRCALTVGVRTISSARRIILMAFGEGKAAAVAAAAEGPVGPQCPASFLQGHPNAVVVLDPASSAELTRVKCPWELGAINWSDIGTVIRAVIWVATRAGRPILRLREEDYQTSYALQELLALHNFDPKNLNERVFNALLSKINMKFYADGSGEGDGGNGDSDGEGEAMQVPQRVLIFSPHPDDDVICMGGTMKILVEQGYEVHVVYQTTGSLAVKDHDLMNRLTFVEAMLKGSSETPSNIVEEIWEWMDYKDKHPRELDSELVRNAKAEMRQCEAASAAGALGISSKNIHFLDSPFYNTGTALKASMTQADISLAVNVLRKVKPHVVFLAGDLSDPHGTHRTCLHIALAALSYLNLHKLQGQDLSSAPEIFLYRGAWQEWGLHEADVIVPLSPAELERKLEATKRHQSQKDPPLFPGADDREFWERARDRNRGTAEAMTALGLPSYEAAEVFVRCIRDEGDKAWQVGRESLLGNALLEFVFS